MPDTYEYFVWVQVTSGTASLHIAINPGAPHLTPGLQPAILVHSVQCQDTMCKVTGWLSPAAGSITDAAGNILYSDPTSPQIFTIVSSDGQYSGIITYPSREIDSA